MEGYAKSVPTKDVHAVVQLICMDYQLFYFQDCTIQNQYKLKITLSILTRRSTLFSFVFKMVVLETCDKLHFDTLMYKAF